MQTTHNLKKESITPARGWLFCEPILGRYETESGIIVVTDLKKNPKIERMRVISVGGEFTLHGRRGCELCDSGGDVCDKKERPGKYWAEPGDTIWMKRGFKKFDIEGKTHCLVHNSYLVATQDLAGTFAAAGDMVLVEPVYDGMVSGSKLIVMHDRDKEYIGNFYGEVIAVGPEYPFNVKQGDKIHFQRHEGVKVEINGRKLLALKQRWVAGVER